MHDIRSIREDPAAFDAALARRNLPPASREILEIDAEHRREQTQIQADLARRNQISKEIGQAMARKDTERAQELMREAETLKYETVQSDAAERLKALLDGIPNLPLADVPDGADETDNTLIHERGTLPTFDFTPLEHDIFGPALGMDFDTGVKLSGSRFTLLRGPMARLHRALGQFMLTVLARDHDYEQIVPPVLVRRDALYGTGQMPKFESDLFKAGDEHWLIPTAEVSLTNMVREQILPEGELPMRFCALTPCFRLEAGAAGRDTRGFIRQHQFEKVEMVAIVTPEQSEAEHERMTQCAEDILTRLGLPFRRMKLCTGDMGFTAARTYDLEVWLPGQGQYREISSCSTCTDFQARRMNARYRPEGEKQTRFVHTLNGSGLAVGRTLVAIMENYQNADGSVTVPDVFVPFMHGVTRLEPQSGSGR